MFPQLPLWWKEYIGERCILYLNPASSGGPKYEIGVRKVRISLDLSSFTSSFRGEIKATNQVERLRSISEGNLVLKEDSHAIVHRDGRWPDLFGVS